MLLRVENIRKEYSTVVAVDNVSFEALSGEILGLLGPNGAGKTTTIRMILNILYPDSGSITFDGQPFSESIRNSLGYLPEERGLYRKNKLLNTILYLAELKGITRAEAKRRAYNWLKRFDLLNHYDRKIEELSKGNQQKVQFIISILHDPSLIVLDEPFSGLDPVNQLLLKDILSELKAQNKSIIFSTHQMEQAEKLCDRICLINKGKLMLQGKISDIKQKYGKNSVHIEFAGDGSFLANLKFVRQATVYNNYAELVLSENVPSKFILDIISSRLDIQKFEYVQPSLNSIFIDVVGERKESPVEVITNKEEKPVNAKIQKNPRLTRLKIYMILSSIIAIVMIIISLINPNVGIDSVLIVVLMSVVFVYQYIREMKKHTSHNEQRKGPNA